MKEEKNKILEFLKQNYKGSYRFIKDKMFIRIFGIDLYNKINEETKFLDDSKHAFSVRVRSFIENIIIQPTCAVCGKDTIFNSNNGWQATCSRSCHMKSPERLKKLKETNLIKYGTTNFLASEQGKNKSKQTNIKKYGVDNYAKSTEFKERIISGDIKPKNNPELNSLKLRMNYYNGLVNGDIVMPLFSFDEYDGFCNGYKMYKWKCKKCEFEYESIIKYHKHIECRKCKPTGTKMEVFIKNFLDQHNINFIYRDRNILNGYEIDVYVPSHKLGIELHGLYWHTEYHKDKNLHKLKADLAHSAGINLIQIFEDELKFKKEIVLSRLKNLLNLNDNKIFARKCFIKEIKSNIKSDFLKNYHIQGNSNTSINYGLYYNNELVSVMTFSKERIALGSKTRNNVYELNRLCSKSNINVIGGASKLLKHFIRQYNPNEIISYADRRWSNGKVYTNMGFSFIKNTEPNYWYTNTYQTREHRFKFRKNVLLDRLENYDKNLTESQNMINHGYAKIWDAGSKKYSLQLC